MPIVIYKGKQYEVNDVGFLANPDSWDEDWTRLVSQKAGISELTEEHWKVIRYLQDYYKRNGIAPMVRILTKVTGYKLKQIYDLFNDPKTACRMAGLSSPSGCH